MEIKNLLATVNPYNDPMFSLFVISTVFLVLILLGIALYLVFGLFKKSQEIEFDQYKLQEAAYADALKIVDEARLQSIKILGDSEIKAQKSIEDIARLSGETKKEIQEKLRHIYNKQTDYLHQLGDELLDSYKQNIKESEEEGLKTLTQTTEYIKKELTDEVKEFKETLKKDTFGTQEEIDARLKKETEEVEAELKAYKEKRLQAIEDEIFTILSEVSSKYLHKTLNASEQERLIMTLLEDELHKVNL